MEHEFEHDWNDLSILDSKLIDKEFDNTIEEDFSIIQRFKKIINEEKTKIRKMLHHSDNANRLLHFTKNKPINQKTSKTNNQKHNQTY